MTATTPKTLVGIQDEYIQTVLAGAARWSHRQNRPGSSYRYGGHFPRIVRGAHTQAFAALKGLGYSDQEAEYAIQQAYDMAKLEMDCEA